MPRYSRAMRLRPVESLKHIIDSSGAVSGASASTTDVINTVDSPLAGTTNQVKISSSVKAIYLRVEVISNTPAGGVDNIYMGVFKNPGGLLTAPALDNVGTSDRRKYMIHQEMVMTAAGITDNSLIPRTIFKGVIVIPRGYSRNGVEDKLQVVLQHQTGEATQVTNFCLQCIYKEFR